MSETITKKSTSAAIKKAELPVAYGELEVAHPVIAVKGEDGYENKELGTVRFDVYKDEIRYVLYVPSDASIISNSGTAPELNPCIVQSKFLFAKSGTEITNGEFTWKVRENTAYLTGSPVIARL